MNNNGKLNEKMKQFKVIFNGVMLFILFAIIAFLGACKRNDNDINYIKQKAENGDAYYQGVLGEIYRRGDELEKNYDEALEWIKKSAEKENPIGLYNLAAMYFYGHNIEKDTEKAEQLFRKSFSGLNELAKKGDRRAQHNIGWMYDTGNGIPRDQKEAVKWYRKSAERGNPLSKFSLGMKYETGEGVEKDLIQAIKWYKESAEQGNANAQNILGAKYSTGNGVKQDLKEAAKWYGKSAEKGNPDGLNNIGLMYELGQGVNKDSKKALELYKKSAEKGNSFAQFNLCRVYNTGIPEIGLKPDINKALYWCQMARKQGNANAINVYDNLLGEAIRMNSQSLFQAIEREDLNEVKSLINSTPEIVNCTQNNGITVLHEAARKGNAEIAEFLLSKGASIFKKDKSGKTPFDIKQSKSIIQLFENYNSQFEKFMNALIKNDADAVKRLLDTTPYLVNTDIFDRNVMPLRFALNMNKINNKKIIELLLKKGANVNQRNVENGSTPLMIALKHQYAPEICKMLVAYGAEINAKDAEGYTVLHLATTNDNSQLMDFFIKKGADIHVRLKPGVRGAGATPLHFSARYGCADCVKFLLNKGADINSKKDDGSTPLHLAVLYNHIRVVKLLLEKGANINARENSGKTPTHFAVIAFKSSSEYYGVLNYLADKRANLHLKDDKGESVVDMVNSTQENGLTPLFRAASNGDSEKVKLLLKLGADTEKTSKDVTPLLIASYKGHVRIVEILLENGANVNYETLRGSTPLIAAIDQGHTEVVRILKKFGAR
jgi:TPR repeat protein